MKNRKNLKKGMYVKIDIGKSGYAFTSNLKYAYGIVLHIDNGYVGLCVYDNSFNADGEYLFPKKCIKEVMCKCALYNND